MSGWQIMGLLIVAALLYYRGFCDGQDSILDVLPDVPDSLRRLIPRDK